MKGPFVRNPYNYDVEAASKETGLLCEDKSLAVQDQRDEVDINTIVERFIHTGRLPDTVTKAPTFADFSEVTDFQTALNAVMAAEAAFMDLPAKVRARFNNDPQLLVEFCSDERNREEAKALGLLVPEAVVPSKPPAEVEEGKK